MVAAGLLATAFLILSAVLLPWRRPRAGKHERREEWFGALVEHGGDLILVVAEDGQLQYASPAVTRLLGYQPAEVVGHNWLELVHSEDAARLADGTATEGRLRRRDGRWVD